MSSWKPLFGVAIAAVLAALWFAPGASATVYCVDDTPGELADNGAVDPSCETPQATIAAAVSAAEAHAGPDSVLIGPGEFTLTPSGGIGAYYSSVAAENTLELRGAGVASTHLTMGSTVENQKGMWIYAPAGSTLGDFELTIPANSDSGADSGMTIGGGLLAKDLLIDGPEASNANGIQVIGGTPSLLRDTIDLSREAWPTNTAITSASGAASPTIVDSHLKAAVGISTSGGAPTIERSTVVATTGSTTDGGSIAWRDSLIELPEAAGAVGVNAANLNNGISSMHATVEGVTIVGGGASSIGIRAQADNGEETASADVTDTVIAGPATPIAVLADNGRTASVSAAYSNFDTAKVQVTSDLNGSGETGTATYEESEVTALEPGFVDAAGGDYRLAAGSELIDRGDPAAPPAEELDLAGSARAVAGTCPAGSGRRDIGAYEFAPTCVEPEAPGGEPSGSEGGGSAGGGSEGTGSEGQTSSEAPTGSDLNAAAATPPDTAIKGPRRVATAGSWARVRLRLSAVGDSTGFRCRVDGHARSCGATLKLRLKRGRHTIKAWALGAAGADPSPARIVVRVVAKRPAQA